MRHSPSVRNLASLAIAVLGIATRASLVEASTPEAWAEHYQEVESRCIAASELGDAKLAGEIVSFSDHDGGFDAVIIDGRDSDNDPRRVLCLFDRGTRKLAVEPADDIVETVPKAVG